MASKPISSGESLREMIEAALDSDDITPLVRLVFDAQHPNEPLPLPIPLDSESGTTTLEEAGAALRENPLEAVLEALQEVAEDKEAEIQQICRSNALEISSALQDLSAMQRQVGSLKTRLGASNTRLQGAGRALLERVDALAAILRVQQGLADTRQAVTTATQVLSLCVRAGRYIECRQLYKAYRVLEGIQRDYGSVLRGPLDARLLLEARDSSSGGPSAPAAPATPPQPPGSVVGAAAPAPAEHLGPLSSFLRDRVNELTLALEQKAMVDFNDWLVTVRTQARTIGLRAVRWAAAERQYEEQLARQRKALAHAGVLTPGPGSAWADAGREIAAALRAPEVRAPPAVTPMPLPAGNARAMPPTTPISSPSPGRGSPREAGSSPSRSGSPGGGSSGPGSPGRSRSPLAGGSFRALRQQAAAKAQGLQLMSPEQGFPGFAAGLGELDVPATPQQQHGEADGGEDSLDSTGDLLAGVDMAPLHRCVHIHACLRRLHSLRDYYVENRRWQLDSDLALHGPFLDCYQAYLAQIVGYFLVEERVQRSTAGVAGAAGLDISAQVGAAWERAVGTLKGVLDEAFQGATAAAAMLTVKDFMLLVCLALEQCGYHSVAIREILMNGRAKYHDLLSAATAETVQAAMRKDTALAPVEVQSEGKAREYFTLLSLPATFHEEDAANKQLPFKAPFTPSVPEIVRVVRGYIVDSVAYLKGLVSAGEVVPAAKQYRDRMLAKVVVAELQRRVDACAGEARLPLGTALQLVANVAALIQALAPLDDFAVSQARGEAAEVAPPRSRSPSPPARGSPPGSPLFPHSAAGTAGSAGSASPGPASPAKSRRSSQEAAAAQQQPGRRSSASQQSSPGGPANSSRSSAATPPRSPSKHSPTKRQLQQQQQQGGAKDGNTGGQQQQQQQHSTLSVFASARAAIASVSGDAAGQPAGASVGGAALQGLLESAEALVVQGVAQRVATLLAGSESMKWTPDKPVRSLEGACSPYIEDLTLYLKECCSVMMRAAPDASVARMMAAVFRYIADAVMLQLMSDTVPAFNIFGLQRLFSDLGGLSRCASSMAVPGLAEQLAEPLLFCELMVFGSLEELLDPKLREGKYRPLNLRRVAIILDKYKELDRASGYAAMHKSKQAERFISRKTVEGVARQLREASRASSSSSGQAHRVQDRSSG